MANIVTEILSRVTGKSGNTVAAVEAALAQASAERESTIEAIRNGQARRRELLLGDDDSAVIAHDLELDRLGIALERLEALEDELVGRLSGLRSEKHRKDFETHRARYRKAAGEFIAAVREASARFAAVTAAIDGARRAGYEAEFSAGLLPTAPHMIGVADPSFIDQFEHIVERAGDAGWALRSSTSSASPAKPIPAPASIKRVSAAPNAAVAAKPKRPPLRETAGPGELLLEVIRDGLEPRDGLQCRVGDRVALPADQARAIAKNGAGEIIELAEAAE